MSEFPLGDRRSRFELAAQLWKNCRHVVTPEQVRAIADRVYDQLDGEVDPLEIILYELEAAGLSPVRAAPAITLVLMAVADKANAELMRVRARL
jgi:hypothetical protein